MITIEFHVPGEPRAKQSFHYAGKHSFTPARIKAWQVDVGWAAQQAMRKASLFDINPEPLTGPIGVDLLFQLGDHRRIDPDNLSKAVLDGLNKICFEDDSQIVDLHIHKTVTDRESAGVWVRIFTMEE